jgi:molybdenum cofactor synthesis domain-containing protein
VGILTCSDRGSRGERADVSGPTIHNLVVDRLGGKVAQYKVVPDDRVQIEQTLIEWVDEARLDLIFTTGGTGFSPRDVTPEATRAVVEREAPAITQAMLFESLRVTPYAMLTRATAGIRRRTLIVNLPGNPKAVNENFDAVAEVLPHAVDVIKGVDTHAAHGGHAGHGGDANHGGQGSDASHGEARHDGHAAHQQHGGDEERRHEAHAGHERHEEHQGHREPAAAPVSGGIARNVGGPTC